MNIPSAAAASVAGIGRAIAKGGTSDDQMTQARADQTKQTAPGGKSEGVEQLEAGDPTQDRGGDGRQVLDQFESQEEEGKLADPESQTESADDGSDDADGHLDFKA